MVEVIEFMGAFETEGIMYTLILPAIENLLGESYPTHLNVKDPFFAPNKLFSSLYLVNLNVNHIFRKDQFILRKILDCLNKYDKQFT